jgi:hypothetical protein
VRRPDEPRAFLVTESESLSQAQHRIFSGRDADAAFQIADPSRADAGLLGKSLLG